MSRQMMCSDLKTIHDLMAGWVEYQTIAPLGEVGHSLSRDSALTRFGKSFRDEAGYDQALGPIQVFDS